MRFDRLPRRLAAASLAAALMTTPALAAFSDTQGHWAGGMIEKWSQEYHIINGYDDGTFRPENPITRGAFAGILDRFMQFQQVSAPETFADTPGTYWETAILKLHAAGVYLGNNGRAQPGDSITRQQAVTMIARAFDVEGKDASALTYWDSDSISEYAKGPVAAMTELGYITDSWDGYFRPTAPITRAEFVNILGNMVQVLIQNPEENSGDVSGTVMINSPEGGHLTNMHITKDLIIAPGVRSAVRLHNVKVDGRILNFSGIEPEIITDPKPVEPEKPVNPEKPEKPGIAPEEVYKPGEVTGEYITYSKNQIPVAAGVEKNRFRQGDFQWMEDYPDRLEYTGRDYRTEFGIDVSAYQNRASENQTIDWDAVRRDGVDFVMVRAGLRGTSTGTIHEDAFFRKNVRGAMDAGLETGVYFFAQAITVEEAIEEADFVLNLLKEEKIDGPVAYDWEMHDSSYRVYGTTPEMATACAIAFCQRIEEAGYEAMIYAGQYVNYMKYDQGAIEQYARWYPEYKGSQSELLYPTFYYQVDCWQFTSSCSIAGIGGRVDANIRFKQR